MTYYNSYNKCNIIILPCQEKIAKYPEDEFNKYIGMLRNSGKRIGLASVLDFLNI
jgi:hypothetical protein